MFAIKNITVSESASAVFNSSNNNVCTNEAITLTLANYNANANYSWSFDGGDLITSSENTVQVAWATAGSKTINLTLNLNGCSATYSQNVEVLAILVAPAITCSNTTNNSVSFMWDMVSNATAYEVYINGNLTETNLATNTFTVDGLDQGEPVTIGIVALGSQICQNSATSTQSCIAQICPIVDLSIPALESISNFCHNQEPIVLQSLPIGGVFTIDGNVVSELTPASMLVGIHTVTVEYLLDSCSYNKSYTISIAPQPDAQIWGSDIVAGDTFQTLSLTDNNDIVAYQWSNESTESAISVGNGAYTVTVTNSAGCTNSDSFVVALIPDAIPPIIDPNTSEVPAIPNAITPNNDGYNDTWQLPDLGETNPSVQIFDRKGQLVWSAAAYQNNFDGHDNQNQALSANTYYYVIRLDKGKPISGSLTVVR